MSKPRVYLETTIISYLAARPSSDDIIKANQQITHDWWTTRRSDFDVFISPILRNEISAGDPEAARRREEFIQGIPLLDLTPMSYQLSEELVRLGAVRPSMPSLIHCTSPSRRRLALSSF